MTIVLWIASLALAFAFGQSSARPRKGAIPWNGFTTPLPTGVKIEWHQNSCDVINHYLARMDREPGVVILWTPCEKHPNGRVDTYGPVGGSPLRTRDEIRRSLCVYAFHVPEDDRWASTVMDTAQREMLLGMFKEGWFRE